METKTLNIQGMSCQMCVKHVTKALQNVNGVVDVQVSLEDHNAVITFRAVETDTSQFAHAVVEAGYTVVPA